MVPHLSLEAKLDFPSSAAFSRSDTCCRVKGRFVQDSRNLPSLDSRQTAHVLYFLAWHEIQSVWTELDTHIIHLSHTTASSAKISIAGKCLLFQNLTNLQHYLFLHFIYKLVFKAPQRDAVFRQCHKWRGSSDSPDVGYLILSAWGDIGKELCRGSDR